HRLVVVCDRRRELLGSQIAVKVGADSTALPTAGVALEGTNKVTAEVDIRWVRVMGRERDNLVVGSHTAIENSVVAGSRNSEDNQVLDLSVWRAARSRCEAAALDEYPRGRSEFPEESGNDGGDPPNDCLLPVASNHVGQSPDNLRLLSGAAIHLPDRMLDLKDFLDAHGGNAPPPAGADLLPRAVVVQPFGLIKMRFYGNWPEERLRSGKPVKYYYLSMDYGHHLSIESLGLEVQLHGPSVCFCPSTLMVLAMSREGGRLHRAAEEVWDRLQEAYRLACRAPGHPTSTFCGQAIFLVPAFETVVCEALLCDQHRRYDVRQKADVCM
ncbi:hypothetical protein D0865_12846, partial [Hortaea werneckii]